MVNYFLWDMTKLEVKIMFIKKNNICEVKFNIESINIEGREMDFLSSFDIVIKKNSDKYTTSLEKIPFKRIRNILSELEKAKELNEDSLLIMDTGFSGHAITIPKWAYFDLINQLKIFEINPNYKNKTNTEAIGEAIGYLKTMSNSNVFKYVFNNRTVEPKVQTLQGFSDWLYHVSYHAYKELLHAKKSKIYEVESCVSCPYLTKKDLGYCELSKRNLEITDISMIENGEIVKKDFPYFCELKFVF